MLVADRLPLLVAGVTQCWLILIERAIRHSHEPVEDATTWRLLITLKVMESQL